MWARMAEPRSLLPLVKHPGCGNYCGFWQRQWVSEDGCTVHDRPGYRDFPVIWLLERPVLLAHMGFRSQDGQRCLCLGILMELS